MIRIRSFGLAAFLIMASAAASADEPTVLKLTLKGNKFDPVETTAPANKPLVLEITNLDATPAEFESKPLRAEKVIAAGGKITVQIRPLPPGRYRFFDDYHEATTEGFLVVK